MLPTPRGGAQDARRRPLRRDRPGDHDRGLEEDPRAGPPDGDPRRPQARPARVRVGRDRGRPGPRGPRAALQGAGEGDGLEEGRGHQAHQPRRRRPARQEGGARARKTRRSSPRSTSRTSRRRATSARASSGRPSSRRRRTRSDEAIRELAGDLCLKTDGKIAKEEYDAIVQWLMKVREMYMDIESRRNDAREAAVEAVRRLETTWQLFKDLEPKMVVNDEQIFRELKDRFGSAVRVRRLLPGRHGRGVDPRAAQGPRPERRGGVAPRDDPHLQGPEAGARDQAAEGRQRVHQVREQAGVDGPRRGAGDPAGAPPDGAARRWPVRDAPT